MEVKAAVAHAAGKPLTIETVRLEGRRDGDGRERWDVLLSGVPNGRTEGEGGQATLGVPASP